MTNIPTPSEARKLTSRRLKEIEDEKIPITDELRKECLVFFNKKINNSIELGRSYIVLYKEFDKCYDLVNIIAENKGYSLTKSKSENTEISIIRW